MKLFYLIFFALFNLNSNYYNIECRGEDYSILAHVEQNNQNLIVDFIFFNEREEAIFFPMNFISEAYSLKGDYIWLMFQDVSKNAIPPKGVFLNYSYIPKGMGMRYKKVLKIHELTKLNSVKVQLDFHLHSDLINAGIKINPEEKLMSDGIIKLKITKHVLDYFYKENGEANTYFFELNLSESGKWTDCNILPKSF